MKKIIQTLLMLSLVFLVSCAAKGPGKPGCPYLKSKSKCEAGCSSSCDKAKKMKKDCGSKCGEGKCGDAKEAKSCH